MNDQSGFRKPDYDCIAPESDEADLGTVDEQPAIRHLMSQNVNYFCLFFYENENKNRPLTASPSGFYPAR